MDLVKFANTFQFTSAFSPDRHPGIHFEVCSSSAYLKAFYAHSVQNPHGWGMMYEDGVRVILKEAVSANQSTFLADFIDSMQPQKTLLAHIRFATVGSVKEENCHPFNGIDDSGREWTMIHNGTIFHGEHNHRYAAQQQGDTDSERFFLATLDAVNRQLAGGIPTDRERFEAINRFIADHAPRNKLNLILYDGDLLYVHKNLKNTLCFKRLENGILFATKPLDSGVWNPFPMRNNRDDTARYPRPAVLSMRLVLPKALHETPSD